jgi:hypothetical protein
MMMMMMMMMTMTTTMTTTTTTNSNSNKLQVLYSFCPVPTSLICSHHIFFSLSTAQHPHSL